MRLGRNGKEQNVEQDYGKEQEGAIRQNRKNTAIRHRALKMKRQVIVWGEMPDKLQMQANCGDMYSSHGGRSGRAMVSTIMQTR